jgi:hypothetical protein
MNTSDLLEQLLRAGQGSAQQRGAAPSQGGIDGGLGGLLGGLLGGGAGSSMGAVAWAVCSVDCWAVDHLRPHHPGIDRAVAA